MRKFVATIAAFAIGLLSASVVQAQPKTRLTIYTALELDQLAPYKTAIEINVPGVEIVWVRDSTGVITARFLAEKDSPRADLVMGLAASSLLLFEKLNLLEAYTPKGSEALKPAFRSATAPATWLGMDAFLGAICYNTVEGQKAGAKAPAAWKDLADPVFKNKLVMPHPASSGTGYLMVAAWLQMMGEEAGWKFMDALHENMAVYTHSGSAPCVQAARGERVAGIALDMRGAAEKTKGAPLDVIIPAEGTGWDMEALAIVKGSKSIDAARKVADWAATKQANEIYAKFYAVVAMPDVRNTPPNYPANAEERMVKNDFSWMAQNRERILAEWSKRYDAKSAPKN